MKFSHKLLSGLALALAFSNAANAGTVEYNYSLISGSNTLSAIFFVDDSLDPITENNVTAGSSFTFNGTQYAVDFGYIKVDNQINSGPDGNQGYSFDINSGSFIFTAKDYTRNITKKVKEVSIYDTSLLPADPTILFDDVNTATFTKVTAVPEPESYGMLLAGLGLVGFATRRKQQAV